MIWIVFTFSLIADPPTASVSGKIIRAHNTYVNVEMMNVQGSNLSWSDWFGIMNNSRTSKTVKIRTIQKRSIAMG